MKAGGDLRTELYRPGTDRFVTHVNAAMFQHFFHVAWTQREAKVEPDRVLTGRWLDAIPLAGNSGRGLVQANSHGLGRDWFALALQHRDRSSIGGVAKRQCRVQRIVKITDGYRCGNDEGLGHWPR